jgi:hypothetical protein
MTLCPCVWPNNLLKNWLLVHYLCQSSCRLDYIVSLFFLVQGCIVSLSIACLKARLSLASCFRTNIMDKSLCAMLGV